MSLCNWQIISEKDLQIWILSFLSICSDIDLFVIAEMEWEVAILKKFVNDTEEASVSYIRIGFGLDLPNPKCTTLFIIYIEKFVARGRPSCDL